MTKFMSYKNAWLPSESDFKPFSKKKKKNPTQINVFSEGSVCFVSRDGHASIVKALIEAGADVKVVNTKTKESPLHFAVQYRGKVDNEH